MRFKTIYFARYYWVKVLWRRFVSGQWEWNVSECYVWVGVSEKDSVEPPRWVWQLHPPSTLNTKIIEKFWNKPFMQYYFVFFIVVFLAGRELKRPKLTDAQRLQEAAIQLLEQQQNICSLFREVGVSEGREAKRLHWVISLRFYLGHSVDWTCNNAQCHDCQEFKRETITFNLETQAQNDCRKCMKCF